MKKWLLFLLIFFAAERFCYWQTKGFRDHRIASELESRPEWEFPITPEQLRKVAPLLFQDYFFLGHGAQCYAFLSADKSTVLKVFKYPRFRPLLNAIGMPDLIPKQGLERMVSLFESLKIAYEELRIETGLIYLHLNQTDVFHQKVRVWDRIGVAHTLDLDTTQFLLQHKAQLAPEKFLQLRRAGNLDEAKHCVDALLSHHKLCCTKGIVDRDPVLERNFGFVGDKAIEVDLGSYVKDPFTTTAAGMKKQLFFATLDFKQWMEKNYPELKDYLEEKISAILAE